MLILAFILNLCFVFAIGATQPNTPIEPDAEKVIALTRETRENYSVFIWYTITDQLGLPREEWAAEFNRGNMHRVETPHVRIVADCETMTGSSFYVPSGEIYRNPKVARTACGIQANSKIISAKVTGTSNGQYGTVTSLRIVDNEAVRTYEVASNGAIINGTIDDRNNGGGLTGRTLAMLEDAPDDIFTEESLFESAVPEEYQQNVQ